MTTTTMTLAAPVVPGRGRHTATAGGDLARLTIDGPLTVVTAARVRRLIRGYVALGDVRLLVDLRGVTAVDACGVAALLDGLRVTGAREGGAMVLRDNPTVRTALKRSGTVSLFRLAVEDEVDAITAHVAR